MAWHNEQIFDPFNSGCKVLDTTKNITDPDQTNSAPRVLRTLL
jgi:hypothetical protein